MSILIYKDNAAVSSISDIVGPSFSKTIAISGNGSYYAKVREVNNDANAVNSPTVAVNCSSGSTPTTPTTPTTPSTGGGFAFQIVNYNCTTGVLQYKMTGGNGSPISLSLPGVFAGDVSADAVVTYTFPGDARSGRTVNGSATQSGSTIAISFTNGCNLTSTPTTTTPTTPTTPTTTNPAGSNF